MPVGTPELIGLVLLFLLGGKKKAGASSSSSATGGGGGGAEVAALLKRANQDAALTWVATFENEGAPGPYADALARWAGIESSGNPRAVSSLNERGLLQLGPAMQSDGALSNAEYEALISPATTRAEHAHLAMKFADWLAHRAYSHVTAPPGPDDHVSAAWYAKLYHQWPVDVRDGKLHGEALPMARELEARWASDPKRLHRLRAANVVAFGVPYP